MTGRVDGHLNRTGAPEDAEEGVEIFLADGVELVVVTARAGNRQALESLREDVDLIVRPLDPVFERIDGLVAVFDHPHMGGADDGLIDPQLFIPAGGIEQVARKVLANQLVIGNIIVERPHEIVAVAPSERHIGIAFAAMRFGVADQIHPAPGKALAETWRIQQAIDQPLVGSIGIIVNEGFDLLRRGGQAG